MIKNKPGISLIELIISMTLLVTISGTITSLYLVGFKTFREQLAEAQIESNAQTILDNIVNDAKNAQSVEESYGLYISDPHTVILKVPAIDNDKNILYSGETMLFDRIIYYFQNNAIHKVIFADPASARLSQSGPEKTLDNKILTLNLTYEPDMVSATLLTINIATNQQVGKVSRSISLTGKARLRNHL